MGYRPEWTDQPWDRNMLPPEYPKKVEQGRPAKYDNRSIMNGILWIAGKGAPWRELSERYGKRQAVYAGVRLWTQRGILEHIFTALREDADMEYLLIDSTFCKVHQSANTGEKRNIRQLACQKVAEIRKSMPLLYRVKLRSEAATSLLTKLTKQKPSETVSSLEEQAIPYRRKAIFQIHGRWIGILTGSVIRKLKWFRRAFTRYDKLDA